MLAKLRESVYDPDRTRGHHRMLIRRRSEVVSDIQ
jgi:hypothetical protein